MRLIDADEFINDARDRYCKDCDKRKGIKSGKRKFIYEIGEVPCRACDVDDMINDLENATTISPDMAQVLAYECGKAERKHGEWIKNEERFGWHCSECKVDNYYAYVRNSETGKNDLQDRYCPNCGAEMRGEAND